MKHHATNYFAARAFLRRAQRQLEAALPTITRRNETLSALIAIQAALKATDEATHLALRADTMIKSRSPDDRNPGPHAPSKNAALATAE